LPEAGWTDNIRDCIYETQYFGIGAAQNVGFGASDSDVIPVEPGILENTLDPFFNGLTK
jgi:hypothetical protein